MITRLLEGNRVRRQFNFDIWQKISPKEKIELEGIEKLGPRLAGLKRCLDFQFLNQIEVYLLK
jgi:hypothetical protein